MSDVPAGAAPDDGPGPGRPGRVPVYSRLLRLRHLHLRGWQRIVLGEGALVAAVLLVLADLASAWTLLVLPVAVAAVVKLHDVVAGLLAGPPGTRDGAGPDTGPAPSTTRWAG